MSEKVNKPEQEEFYDILQNAAGELLISIRARDGGAEDPKIVYDGGEHALLYRSKGFSITLDFIHPEAREPLFSVDKVLIVEFSEDEVVREYDVPVKKVKKLPIAPENLPKLP